MPRPHHRPRSHVVLAGALLLLGFSATTSGAAPAGCPLVTDPRGDVRLTSTALDSQFVGVDLLSGDVATDRGALTVVLALDAVPAPTTTPRVEAYGLMWSGTVLAGAPDSPGAATRGSIRLVAQESNGHYDFFASHHTAGDVVSSTVTGLAATGSVDAAKGTVRISVLLSALAPLTSVAPGTKWQVERLDSTAFHGTPPQQVGPQHLGPGGFGSAYDQAMSGRTVVVGKAGCAR